MTSTSSLPTKIPFSCVSANGSFKGIIREPLTTLDFLVSFFKTRLYRLFRSFFVALFARYSCIRKFLFLCKVVNIIRQWGSDDDVAGRGWGVPRFRDIPLGLMKVPGSGFLGFVTSRLLNL